MIRLTKTDPLRTLIIGKAQAESDRQLAQLRATSPLRPADGLTHDVDGLGLFDHARQPSLF